MRTKLFHQIIVVLLVPALAVGSIEPVVAAADIFTSSPAGISGGSVMIDTGLQSAGVTAGEFESQALAGALMSARRFDLLESRHLRFALGGLLLAAGLFRAAKGDASFLWLGLAGLLPMMALYSSGSGVAPSATESDRARYLKRIIPVDLLRWVKRIKWAHVFAEARDRTRGFQGMATVVEIASVLALTETSQASFARLISKGHPHRFIFTSPAHERLVMDRLAEVKPETFREWMLDRRKRTNLYAGPEREAEIGREYARALSAYQASGGGGGTRTLLQVAGWLGFPEEIVSIADYVHGRRIIQEFDYIIQLAAPRNRHNILALFLMRDDKGRLVGARLLHTPGYINELEMDGVRGVDFVRAPYQGQGLGTELRVKAFEWMKQRSHWRYIALLANENFASIDSMVKACLQVGSTVHLESRMIERETWFIVNLLNPAASHAADENRDEQFSLNFGTRAPIAAVALRASQLEREAA